MADLQKTWTQKLSEAEEEWQERDREERKRQERRKTTPHLWNLNEDPLLTNTYVHLMPPGQCKYHCSGFCVYVCSLPMLYHLIGKLH